ncbi:hypothetical protein BCR34DRAFT_629047 [Clohesyomyces aquaticus]|uniref:Peptide hydrolase n=1 Tax=Clohesyomyces aquaticus TaxID=1231657 RepID=A0A1Y1YBM5_9PLEO|nr:hypothetical protein BCR34DRAFT_629047 [Clohesyomyces aquaticus]
MKFASAVLVLSASSAVALTIPRGSTTAPTNTAEKLYTIELGPGEISQATESQKWELRKQGKHFLDITDYLDFDISLVKRQAVTFPTRVSNQASVTAITARLNKANMQTNLETFSSYNNRYYKSTTGAQSSTWLFGRVNAIIAASGAAGATAKAFTHTWTQSSVIATIPGASTKTIVIGAHQDSINLNSPMNGRAPGADDDGSGSVTILEAFRVLLSDPRIASGQAPNTIEFHWYLAEEGGLLGSQAIFNSYKNAGRKVVAMLQQDMTGYVQATLNASQKESVGIITDYVDTGLTEFIKKVVTAYCRIPYAAMEYTSDLIHTTADTISTVNFDHMIEHGKMTVGFAYELAFAAL